MYSRERTEVLGFISVQKAVSKTVAPLFFNVNTAYIIDGMFITNSSPISVHTSFAAYVDFLFSEMDYSSSQFV